MRSGVFKINLPRLEREVNAAAHHPEVAVVTGHEVPAKIVGPADVAGEADFKTTANLADSFGLCTVMHSVKKGYYNVTYAAKTVGNDLVALSSAKNSTEAAPDIGREA